MSSAHPAVQLAGTAQKMVNILFFNCPANYACGGPTYAAQAALDTILHQMGIGVAILSPREKGRDMSHFEEHLRHDAVIGESLIKTFIQHKGHILAGALHSVISNNREKTFRENHEVTRDSLLMLMQYYFDKSGDSKEDFWKELLKNDHDELTQLEKDAI